MNNVKLGFTKQTQKLMLATTSAVLLGGCQLLSSSAQVERVPQKQLDSYAQTVITVSDHIDLYLSQRGRDDFLAQISTALESDSRSTWKGKDRNTDAHWQIEIQQKEQQTVAVNSPVVDEVDTQQQLEFVDIPYRSKTKLSVRSAPSIKAERLGMLGKGEVFNAVAQVVGQPWLLVEQQGVIKGYVHRDYTFSNVEQRDILTALPNPLISPHLIKEQFVTAPSEANKPWSANYTCRYLTYHISNDINDSEGQLKACRKQRKVWFIDAPINANHRS